MGKLDGKVALITGGASGIGLATARSFATEGAHVVIADYNQTGAEAAAESLKAYGARALRVNVADGESVQQMIADTVAAFGTVHILINSAGTGELPGPIHEKDEHDWARVLAVNVTGTFLCMKYALPHMLSNGHGVILNLASIGGILGFPNSAAYAASKGAVIQLTRAAALEYARQGIRVNAIAPGWVETPMVDAYTQSGIPIDRLMRGIPLGRLGKPEEIAALLLFLAGDEAGFLLGSTVVIDGGISIA
jgi:NAD(P)-dependent dehydrogenase (short-subunit alcohol dehydrogenase family)